MNNHKCEDNLTWTLAINETGWKCINCQSLIKGDPDGFSPEYDKSQIQTKVADILHGLDDDGYLRIANGSEGDVLERMVANRCRNENRFDQYSIIRFIYDLEAPRHADYWRKISMGIREGHDPRDRCECGRLAQIWSGGNQWCSGCYDSTRTLAEADFYTIQREQSQVG